MLRSAFLARSRGALEKAAGNSRSIKKSRTDTLDTPQQARPKLLFFSTLNAPFIVQDENSLARRYDVERLHAHGLIALTRIPQAAARNRLLILWFGSVYAGYAVFFARALRRRSVIVVAGVDAAKDKEIGYGIWLHPLKALIVRYAFRHADRLLAVDPFLQREVMRLAEYDGHNIEYVPFGYDPSVWRPAGSKVKMVLTVAACHDRPRMKKKGIDQLFGAARALPRVRFCIIGIQPHLLPDLLPETPENVEVVPYVPQHELLWYYQQAKVYCQPSYTEGLPNTLCEAMLCGCVPVGTKRGGIPTAIGDAGHLVEYGDRAALVKALDLALDSPPEDGRRARERIMREFPLQKRTQSLYRIIDELCS